MSSLSALHTNLNGVAYCSPRLYGNSLWLLGYKPVQHVTGLNTVGNYDTVEFVYRNISKQKRYSKNAV